MRLTLVCIAIGCSSVLQAQKTPPVPVKLPDMYNLSLVPARPALAVGSTTNTMPFVKDPKTGKYVRATPAMATPVDSTAKPDTNDARTYYDAGVAALGTDPAGAAAAFYWASRINPAWAEPYFGRWYTLTQAAQETAVLKKNTKEHKNDPLVPDTTLKRLDSLVILADIHDPFFDERLALDQASANVHGELALANSIRNKAIMDYNDERMRAGWVPLMGVHDLTMEHTWYGSYVDRHFDSAAADLARLIKKHPDAIQLYIYRAKAQYYQKLFDSAAATLSMAVSQIEKRDTTKLLPAYISRDMLTYSIAMANQQAHHDSAARANFQLVVTQNLGFHMAHLHLASQALDKHDTATAINEANIAAQIRPDDPVVQLFLGYALINAGHMSDGIDHLRQATTVDPYYSLPYYYLGQALEQAGNDTAAVSAYKGYLAHAARNESMRKNAEDGIAMLQIPKQPPATH